MKKLFISLVLLPLVGMLMACVAGDGFPVPYQIVDDEGNVVVRKTVGADGQCVTVAIPQTALGDNVQIGTGDGSATAQYGEGCAPAEVPPDDDA